jgi:flagellar basal body P-ring protein FlgI
MKRLKYGIAGIVLGIVALASPAVAQTRVRFEGDVLRIDYERMGFLTSVREHPVIVRANDQTLVYEDRNPARFGDIIIGDHVQVAGVAVRRGDRIVVVARAINIVNRSPGLLGDSFRVRGRILAVDCDRHGFLALIRDHRVPVRLAPDALITAGRDGEVLSCADLAVGDCFVAIVRPRERNGHRFLLTNRMGIVPCP